MSQFTLKQENVLDADVFTFTDEYSPGASGDATSDIVQFSTAQTREPITSGSTLAQLFSSIKKWFTDLKAVCFSGSYTDLINTPDLDLKADKSYADWIAGFAENSVSQIQFNDTVQAISNDIDTKANQSDLDTTNDNIDAVIDEINTLDGKVYTNTSAINNIGAKATTNASAINTLKGASGLYEKANRSAVDALTTTVNGKASLTSFNSLTSTVNKIIAGVNTENINLSTVANAAGMANNNIAMLAGDIVRPGAGIATKANLSYVDNLFERTTVPIWDDYGTHGVSPERVIGKFNGSPLYGRTMFINELSSTSGATSYAHYIDNVGMIINGSGSYGYNGITHVPIPFISIAVIDQIGLTFNTTNVNVIVGKNLSAYSATIFIEYTKTTDW